jgi:hypothetical protein
MQDFCRSFRRQADQRQKERPPEKKVAIKTAKRTRHIVLPPLNSTLSPF